jgi:uncharacterized coiled-coil protein SlyX
MDVKNAHERIDKLESKLSLHDTQLVKLSESLADNTMSLHENTRLTQQIANNTDEIVSLFKGSKVLYKIITGGAALIAIGYTLFHWISTK